MLLNLGLGVFLLGVVVFSSGQDNIKLWAAPVEGAALTRQLWIGSIYALAATALALRRGRWWRLPMLAWNMAVPVVIVWSVSRASFSFESAEQIRLAAYLVGAALLALCGSWLHFRAAGGKRRR